eukprot:TRINITY_DN1377_c0_g1::TRINITY_DN1377_c0_g1_i1::g.20115::m.20115 TRINITY_DN1377_c0_g1::TRINITY_DN1377_c0_g1_i1::g.20115  ORF type:complete len:539 (-),score=128.16,sp/B9A1H3/TRXR1_EMIHU/62.55/0.0,Pyr_redox_2/PF07992.9/1.3e-35,Pyr_redox_dim/PF02852.17/3.3e-31,Pyr_redox/PF00070.22/5.2,Pyr_redox/PF00070.22/1.3e-12,Pyr_redox_3/PF13738.1/1.2e-08,FAD_binding_2/PF00890.19/9.2e-06,FAD_binding_2/PF00890.19/4.5e+02,FAD_binding_2/PF00890.19/1.5e+02,K_oxygenase/PF13434.1/0.0039,K_oxygenase/PF13434.1/98,GIDA/
MGSHGYDYDLIVIGGGSGGLAASKEAAVLGKKVAVFDYVKPSPAGTTWGLGGTCVNVGCIPKKLMHQAALLGEAVDASQKYGWNSSKGTHNWTTLVEGVQNYIGSLNWGYRVALRDKDVTYKNEYAVFVDTHTVEGTNRRGQTARYTAEHFIVSTGGRPKYPEIPGAKECCISSDDLFSLKTAPGKTLVVGASYVSLECAGFLHGLGYDTTVMVRSILLRGFDQQMAIMAGDYMEKHGVRFLRPCSPTKFEKLPNGRVNVEFINADTKEVGYEEFDTVMLAIGRDACTTEIGIDKIGVALSHSGKVLVKNEQTNVTNVFAIGDIVEGGLELTPVAIQAGRLLARRLYAGSKAFMDYDKVPTTVFTPLEYGACGLSEERAIELYGRDNIEVYHSYLKPLEWTVAGHEVNACYCKLICNKADQERVLGLHILGPHAGEVTQGFAVAIKMGATKQNFDDTIGIHPTVAEEFTTLSITKSSNVDATKTGC